MYTMVITLPILKWLVWNFFGVLECHMMRLKKRGIWLPVSEYNIKYLKPALYDQELRIEVKVKERPGVRIIFDYEIYNEEDEKLTEASTTLFFLDAEKNKVVKCPDWLMQLMDKHF